MKTQKAVGSITISDITDVGRVSAYLTSNLPASTVYDPNDGTYTPDWSTTNLVVTPIVYFNDTKLDLTATGLSISWTRKDGANAEGSLSTGETVSNGVLTVANNVLGSTSSDILTYSALVRYTDPDTNILLETKCVITFTLLRRLEPVKDISITGESVFMYNSESQLIGNSTIVLTAHTKNTSVLQWQYKNSAGNFVAMSTDNNTLINGTTINISVNEGVLFTNDTAVIKVTTPDASVYDIHTITKIRDGAAGNSTVSVVLTNESHTLPCNSKGIVNSYNGADTQINIYEGGTVVTDDWAISATPSTGVSGNYDSASHTYTVTGLSTDTGYVEFSCSQSGKATVTKRFTLIKQYAGVDGADAVIYTIEPSTYVINIDKNGVYSPANVTFSAYSKVGAELTKTAYEGRFVISESTDGTTFGSPVYTSANNESTKTYTPSSTSIRVIECKLYASGGTTTLLDSQTVTITKDGSDGNDGNDGKGGTSVILGNEAEVIPCNTDGTVRVKKDITIPFYGYIGTARAAITCTVGTLPSGVTVTSNTAGTTSAGGQLVISIPAGNTLGSTSDLTGNFTLTFTCNSTTVEKKFSWTKSLQSQNSILLQVYAPGGDVIVNGANNVTLESQLTDGSNVVYSGITYQWSKFSSGSYVDIADATGSSLTVTPDMVDALASFKCTATYGGKAYSAFWTVTDKTDPVDLVVLCSVGTQLKADVTCGAVYALAYQNGIELDALKTTVFTTSLPSSAQSGDYCYYIDKTNKTVILKKYNGSAWADAPSSDQPSGTYEYYRRNRFGDELDTSVAWKTGKVIYVDRDVVDGTVQLFCEAEIPIN